MCKSKILLKNIFSEESEVKDLTEEKSQVQTPV